LNIGKFDRHNFPRLYAENFNVCSFKRKSDVKHTKTEASEKDSGMNKEDILRKIAVNDNDN